MVGSSACAAMFGKAMTPQDNTSPARITSRAGREKRAIWVNVAPCDPDNFLYYSEIPVNVKLISDKDELLTLLKKVKREKGAGMCVGIISVRSLLKETNNFMHSKQ